MRKVGKHLGPFMSTDEIFKLSGEESFRTLAQSIPQMIWTAKPDGSLDYFNARWSEYTGFTFEDMQVDSEYRRGLLHPDDFDKCMVLWSQALQSGMPFEDEYRFRRADGVYRWHLARALPLRNSRGEIVKWFGTTTDINDYKRIQEQALTAEQHRKTAEDLSRIKSQFLANMTHEIRTPLNAVIGMVDVLMTTHLSPGQSEYVGVIHNAANHLLSLLNDILDLSKIEAGKMELSEAPYSLRNLISALEHEFSASAAQKNLTFSVIWDPKTPNNVMGDQARLRQILVNLVGNALKFTPQGFVILQIGGKTAPARLRFDVIDSGIGIKKDVIPHLFTPFIQADSSTTRQYGGTGLGLSICKELVERMGGTLGVDSTSRGSRFWFEVPAQTTTAAPSIPEDFFKPVARTKQVGRILVAEDNPINQKVLVTMLDRLGFSNQAVESGDEVLVSVEVKEPILILMDCQMPKMDGYETAQRLRQMQKNIPIVAVTASAVSGEKERCLEAGMNDILFKPLKLEQLRRTLERWLPVD